MKGLEIDPNNENLIETKNTMFEQISKMGGEDPKELEKNFETLRQKEIIKEKEAKINKTKIESKPNSVPINKEVNKDKNDKINLIEKYCLNKRVVLKFVKQISEYRFEGKILEISGGFIYFKREDKYNNTEENHIINLDNIIDIHIL